MPQGFTIYYITYYRFANSIHAFDLFKSLLSDSNKYIDPNVVVSDVAVAMLQ